MKKFLFLLALLAFACGTKTARPPFQKIVYHTSTCFGYCPVYHLEANADGTVRLHIEKAYKPGGEPDLARTGFYSGKLDPELSLRLETEIKKINLSKLNLTHTECCDGVLKTIIIYRNGKREFIREMFEPEALRPLVNVLNEVCKVRGLERVAAFEVEGEKGIKN